MAGTIGQQSTATGDGPVVTGEVLHWDDAVTRYLTGTTCLWQDLDGLHVEPPPAYPPHTSIMWAWDSGAMVRMRLDGTTAYVARCERAEGTRVVPWQPTDGRVQGFRRAATGAAGLDLILEQVVIDGVDNGSGPITFIRAADPEIS